MKNKVVGSVMNIIKNENKYDEVKLAEIKYGLEGLYLTITKLIFIFTLAIVLNIFKEMIIFLLIYNVMRTFSFGLHATKSWICLISSTIIFIMCPIICEKVVISIPFKVVLGIVLIFLYFKNAPADTKKRPIVNPKRRLFFKFTSTILAILFVFLSILIKDNFISNCFIVGLLVQAFLISPIVYKFFKLPYNNYLTYNLSI